MSVSWIDHVVVPVASLDEASAPYERLGLHLTPVTRHAGLGTENRAFFVGDGSNDFYVELLAIHDREMAMAAAPERTRLYLDALDAGRGIARVMVGCDSLDELEARLAAAGHYLAIEPVVREGGSKICDVMALEPIGSLGMPVGAIAYAEDRASQHSRRAAAGYFAHDFPLGRVDHLAAVAPGLAATTRAWHETLGVGLHGVVPGTGLLIHQLKMGDAILELLGPDSPASPLASRPPGLASMVAWEVAGLDEAVALARDRGFTPSDARPGPLPGTRVATIPASELAGVAMQMLVYE